MMAVVRSTTTATETYHGYVETTDDALRILEACRRGTLKRRSRRLCESERTNISSGSLFVWDESESGIRRWTDGKRWSPSRVNGCFLVYTELHPRPSSSRTSDIPLENGLVKKALSLFTNTTSKLHLVCYFRKEDVDKGRLKTPAEDPLLCNIKIPRSLYPDIIPEMSQTPDRSNSGGSSLAPFSLHRERRVSVAVAPIMASRGSSKPLPYLQTNDCQLVASTQPHFAHPDRDASSAQWSPSLLQQLQQQQAALDHTESSLSHGEYKSPPATATKGLAITMDNSQQGIRLPDVDLQ
ncbi:Gluconate transport-inducing protein, partial [Coemansia sp. RSA 1933]